MSNVRPFARGLVLSETAGDEHESTAAGVQAIEVAAGDTSTSCGCGRPAATACRWSSGG